MATVITGTKNYPIGPGLIWGQSGDDLTVTFRTPTQKGIFTVSSSNTSGTNTARYSFEAEICPNQLQISPNPATSSVNTPLSSSRSSEGLNKKEGKNFILDNFIRQVNIYSANGVLKKQQLFNGKPGRVQMDISELSSGIYIVEVSSGKGVKRGKLAIQRN